MARRRPSSSRSTASSAGSGSADSYSPWVPCWPSCRSGTRAREAALALADPARRRARAGAARLRVRAEPARHSLAARRAAGARLPARHARGRTDRAGRASGQGRRREVLGLVVLSRLLRGSPGARAQLARLPRPRRGGGRRRHPGQARRRAEVRGRFRPHLPGRPGPQRHGLGGLRRVRRARDLLPRSTGKDPAQARRRRHRRRLPVHGGSAAGGDGLAMTRGAMVLIAVLTALALVGPAAPAIDAQTARPVNEETVHDIAVQLRCVVCQNLSVADSPSEMASQMRAIIRERLAAGESPADVQRYFVDRYGEWILLSPPRRGFNLLVWLLPLAAVVVGLAATSALVWRWTHRRRGVRTAPAAVDPAMSERIRRELERES